MRIMIQQFVGLTESAPIYDEKGKELIRHNPFSTMISRGEVTGQEIIPELLAELEETIKDQHGSTLKEFLLNQADTSKAIITSSDDAKLARAARLALMSTLATSHGALGTVNGAAKLKQRGGGTPDGSVAGTWLWDRPPGS